MITKSIQHIMTRGMQHTLFLLLAPCFMLLSSCNNVVETDDDYVVSHDLPNSGAPVITGVYAAADADFQKPLYEVVALQRVVIAGQNLNNLRSVRFNGVEADLTQSYTQLTKAVVQVPAGYTKASSNTVEYTTDQGTAIYTFTPPEVVYSFDLTQATQQLADKNVTVETDAEGTPCLHFSGTITEWAWVELGFAQPFGGLFDAAIVDQYNFAFEVKTVSGSPLLDSGYEFAFNWNWNSSFRWSPGDGLGLDTQGQWQTVRYALELMAPDGLSDTGGDLVVNVGFQPDRDYEADFRLAGFRIEKK